jgi:hypothetical protein
MGRLYRGILVPFVADMLALRQVVGLLGSVTAHNFCSMCNLDIDDINVLDPNEWPAKSPDEIRHFAMLWKQAKSEEAQENIFQAYRSRWSALLDLPYWDPVCYTIIDTMHALDLGLLQTHCRTLFKIDLNTRGGDGSASQAPILSSRLTGRQGKAYKACLRIVLDNGDDMISKLLSFHRTVLYTICVDFDIHHEGKQLIVSTKWVLAKNIACWVSFVVFCRSQADQSTPPAPRN